MASKCCFVILQGLPGAEMSAVGIELPPSRSFATLADPDRLKTLKVFVRQPADQIGGAAQSFKFRIEDKAGVESAEYTATFNAPETAR